MALTKNEKLLLVNQIRRKEITKGEILIIMGQGVDAENRLDFNLYHMAEGESYEQYEKRVEGLKKDRIVKEGEEYFDITVNII